MTYKPVLISECLNLNQAPPSDLYLSSNPKSYYGKDILKELGITDIVLLLNGPEADHIKKGYEAKNIRVLHCPIEDFTAPKLENLKVWIPQIRALMYENTGRKILMHCQAGLGRTGTMAACVALSILNQDATADTAIKSIRSKIFGAVETKPQEKCIAAFAKYLRDPNLSEEPGTNFQGSGAGGTFVSDLRQQRNDFHYADEGANTPDTLAFSDSEPENAGPVRGGFRNYFDAFRQLPAASPVPIASPVEARPDTQPPVAMNDQVYHAPERSSEAGSISPLTPETLSHNNEAEQGTIVGQSELQKTVKKTSRHWSSLFLCCFRSNTQDD